MSETEQHPDIGERYRLQGMLGNGGMGKVYLAEDRSLKRKVAVKILKPELDGQLEEERFRREAAIIAQMNHPNIVPVYDVGSANGHKYIVMEYVEGRTLQTILDQHAISAHPVPEKMACDIIVDVLSALSHSHGKGIIHRDVKPSNILISDETKDGRPLVKLTDFGIAKRMQKPDGENTLTLPNSSVGTAGYMPPEQISGSELDTKADSFPVAAIFYELLSGNMPFGNRRSTKVDQRNENILYEEETSVPGANPALEGIILKNLERRPRDRQTSDEFLESVRSYLSGHEVILSGKDPRQERISKAAEIKRQEMQAKYRRRGFLAAAVIGLCAAVAIPVYFLERSGIKIENHPKYPSALLKQIEEEPSSNRKIALFGELEHYAAERMAAIYRTFLHAPSEASKQKEAETIAKVRSDNKGMNDAELEKRISAEVAKLKPQRDMFPIGTSSKLGGQYYPFAAGDTGAAHILAIFYDLFKHYSEPQFRDKEKADMFLREFFHYSSSLFISQENEHINLTQDRFAYPVMIAETDLAHHHPNIYHSNERQIRAFKEEFANATKMLIETRYNAASKTFQRSRPLNPANKDVDSNRDHRVMFAMSSAFRFLDLRREVLPLEQHGSSLKTVEQYLQIMMDDGDTKLSTWVDRETADPKMPLYQQYMSLIEGLAYRINLLDDIERWKMNTGIKEHPAPFISNVSALHPAFFDAITAKKKEYSAMAEKMIDRMVAGRKSLIFPHSFAGDFDGQVDAIATIRLVEAIRELGWPQYQDIRIRALTELSHPSFISGNDRGIVDLSAPNGIIKNTWYETNPEMRGMTFIETDREYIKNLRAIRLQR